MLNHANFIFHLNHKDSANTDSLGLNVIKVCWSPPPDGCFKVNVDGSHINNPSSSACGGLIRDANGNFVKGFYSKVGSCNAVWAELWALRLGITLAHDLNLPWVMFEMDSKVVVEMVHKKDTHISFLKHLLQEVISLFQLPSWRTSITHTYREANKCVDLLANKGHETSYDGVILDTSFNLLDLLLSADARGVCSSRLIA